MPGESLLRALMNISNDCVQLAMLAQEMSSYLRKIAIALAIILLIGGCSNPGHREARFLSASPSREMTLVSFTVTRRAYDRIIPLFTEQWLQNHGESIAINRSYGPSGPRTRAIIDGLPADVVALPIAADVTQLEREGLVDLGWEEELPNGAIVHQSVPVIISRSSNSASLTSWANLAQSDLSIVLTNPKTSGVARWIFMALWGSVLQQQGTAEEAMAYVTQVYGNAPLLSRDAREAADAFFNRGLGDVLINYEQEAILAKRAGEGFPYVVPSPNIAMGSAVAVVDANVDRHGNRDIAEAFCRFLFTAPAQQIFAEAGFRSIDPTVAAAFVADFPPVEQLYSIEDLGGWDLAQEQFFQDGAMFDQIQGGEGINPDWSM